MRFRLNTQGGAGDGFGRGFSSLFQAPINEALAGEQAQDSAFKRQLTSAQIAAHVAQAAHSNAQADLTRTEATSLQGAPDVLDRVIASRSGVDVPTVASWRNQISTGKAPSATVPGDPTADAPVEPAQVALPGLDPQVMQRIGTEYSRLSPALINPSKFKVDDLAQASGAYQKQDAVDKIVAAGAAGAPGMAALFGQGFAASEGKPLVDNVGNTGRSMNKFTGQGGTIDPGLSALYDKGEQAQTFQRSAAGTASLASARHSDASTNKVNQELEQGKHNGNLQVVTGPNGEVTIIDKVNRTAEPVLGADGKAVIKGAAGGGGKPLTGDQAKANLYGGRMTESDSILSDLEGKGVTNTGITRNIVQGAVGVLPLIGDKLSAAAGSGMNVLPGALGGPSSQQQQVDQARRDFVNAVMRRESGAAISQSEFDNANRQYFPQPGDKPAVLEQKRRNRQIATTLMLQEVPEAQRYKKGTGYKAPAAGEPTPAAPVAPEGSWAPGSGKTVQVSY